MVTPLCANSPGSTSRPATAAHSSNRTQPVESRANRRRNVSETLVGICVRSCHPPCAISSLVNSRTKNGLPPLRCHNWAVTAGDGFIPGRRASIDSTIASTSVGAEADQGQLLRRARELDQLRWGLGVTERSEQQHLVRRQRLRQEAEQLNGRLVGPLQVVEHHQHERVVGHGGEAATDRVEQAELGVRGCGSCRGLRCSSIQQTRRVTELRCR